jgi:hypothetical protein
MGRLRKWDLLAVLAAASCTAAAAYLTEQEVMATSRRLRDECMETVQALRLQISEYRLDHVGDFPESLDELGLGPDALRCPYRAHQVSRGYVPASSDPDYIFFAAGWKKDEIADPARLPALFDRPGNHADGSRTVLFADGAVERISEAELEGLLGEVQGGAPEGPTAPSGTTEAE